ncbi:ankyrin repeat-containing protein At2g01680 [Fagus crenata]
MDPKLFKAAMTGDVHFLESLNEDDNSNFLCQVTPKKNTVLHIAAEFNQLEFVRVVTHRCPLLFQSGNSNGDTPLHVAAKVGCCEIVGYFISHAQTLQVDVESGHVDESHKKKELLRIVNVDKDTALHCATRNGHYQSVKLLIEADPELSNLTNNAYESTLYLAASRDFRDIAELILNASPSSSSHVGPNGITALHAAVYSESRRVFLGHFFFTGSKEAFLQPKVSTEKEFMEILLEKKPNIIRERDNLGWTALHYAACFGLAELVRQFLNHDSFVAYVLDNDGESALHIAAYYGEINSIKEMIKSCPDICDLTKSQRPNSSSSCSFRTENIRCQWGFGAEKRVRYLLKAYGGIQWLQQRISTSNLKQPPVDARSSSSLNTKDMDNAEKPNFEQRNTLETNLLVAMLVATVSFAAAFTMPGGYKSDGPDQGLANLTAKVAFKAFVIFDTIAFLFSVMSW